MDRLYLYFTEGTQGTKTGASMGMEVETDFLLEDGSPLPIEAARQILLATDGRPFGCEQKLELGQQKIELSMAPQPNSGLMLELAEESLAWLYGQAAQHGAYPLFAPEVQWDGDLLWVQEERDAIWVDLDGRPALEELCRCSSVQFSVSVHPDEAIVVLNRLHAAQLHDHDYAPNHQRWLNYIAQSAAGYGADRYGGPEHFLNLQDYVAQLVKHEVVMHQGQPIGKPFTEVADADIELFLRSIWWHYRLRRYGDALAVEMRPFARRQDASFAQLWQLVAETIGL